MDPSTARPTVPAPSAGVAALYLAATYLAGIAIFVLVLDYPGITDALGKIAVFEANLRGLQLAHLGLYVVFGFALMLLVWTLHARLRAAAPTTMRVASSVGLVWAGLLVAVGLVTNAGMELAVGLVAADPERAVTAWLAVEAVTTGLGGGNGEVLGGLWTLLVSAVAWRARALAGWVCAVGAVAGIAGIASAVPGLAVLVAPFALGQVVWFVALGVTLLRPYRSPAPA